MKQACTRLRTRQKGQFVRWLQTQDQTAERLTDDEMMAIAAEGAPALDQREAEHAKGKAR